MGRDVPTSSTGACRKQLALWGFLQAGTPMVLAAACCGPTTFVDDDQKTDVWDSSTTAGLSRGHRILLAKGMQIQAMAFPVVDNSPGFSPSRVAQANFTGLSFWEAPFPTAILGDSSPLQWSRFTTLSNSSLRLSAAELKHLPQLVNMQYYDEPGGATGPGPAQTATIGAWIREQHARYPGVISHTDISGVVGADAHRAFVAAAQPDMVLSSWYPWSTDPGMPIVGGTPVSICRLRKPCLLPPASPRSRHTTLTLR